MIRHTNASSVDTSIVYRDPVMHSTGILMINHAIKIDSMPNILICLMQFKVNGPVVDKCPKFLPASFAQDNHALLFMTLMAVAHPSLSCCPWTVLPVTWRPYVPAFWSMRTRISPSNISCPKACFGTPLLPYFLVLIAGG